MGAQTIIQPYTTQALPEPDVSIYTSGGTRIQAHSIVLASVSPVFENIIDRPCKHGSSERIIQIYGVPCKAVAAFITFLYSSKCCEDEMEKYGMHMLTLSHVYMVPQLKQRCIKGLSQWLSVENVVDMVQLARLCDAPDLRLKCMKLLTTQFKAVEKTEGWEFLNKNDPWLELEILRLMDEHETRKEKLRRQKKEQEQYAQLGEAMECLEHICSEGCTDVGPCHVDIIRKEKRKPCSKFSTCQSLQLLILHFATCKNRINGGCLRCNRMWQLFKLHSYVCQRTDSCTVPLCRQIQLKMQHEKRKDDARWKLLAKKVASAKVICSLFPKRKRDDKQS